ncbi:MAG: TraB/GumN family protein [Flavobacteriales bacterium]|jgi:uncharacterized protein YbaP (TraB family)|nr:TraB/GumN family protein [Flavobacteriales bacterium]
MKNKHIILTFLLISSLFIAINAQDKYRSLCWKITGDKLAETSYLYGTFHSQDNRVFQFKEGVEEAFQQADIYAMELNMDSINRSEMLDAMLMDSGQTLKTLLSPKEYDLVNQFFIDSVGMSLFLFNKMQPIVTTQIVVTKDLNQEQQNALDMHWFKKAKKEGKLLVGLETMDEQVNAFKSIPVKTQAEELVKAVKDYGKKDKMSMDDMLAIYVSGDLDSLMTVMDQDSENSSISMEDFNEQFLYRRNTNMANRVEAYLLKGSVFMAVGAAHLPGEKGVIELLRAKGYRVEPL